MTLTDAQCAVLDVALARPDRRLEPLPATLKGGAARKVIDALVARGLAEPGPDGPVVTRAAVAAAAPAQGADDTPAADGTPVAGTAAPEAAPALSRVRSGTKQD